MQCELCGTESASTRRVVIEKIPMVVCPNCARFGQDLTPKAAKVAEPGVPAEVSERLERRARKMGGGRDVFESLGQELVPDWAKRIKDAREKRGMTREQLSAKVGERVPTLAKYESGEIVPPDAMARRLERELAIKLLEPVPAVGGAVTTATRRSLTLGDLLKEARKKEEE